MKIDIKDKLEKIDKDHYSLLVNIGKIAHEEGQKAYLVGGMVRDLLLGFDNLDIDIVVENNAKLLADVLVKKIPDCELAAKHDRFHTSKVIFNIHGKKIPVDLASTRQEIYEHPAALPTVSVSDLKKDLYRRDFTINALAVSLLPDSFGEIVDLFNSLIEEDLVTSQEVIVETLNWLVRKANKKTVIELGEILLKEDITRIIQTEKSDTLFALEIIKKYSDHNLSFTDAISFVVIKKLKIKKVFSLDKDFNLLKGVENVYFS